MHGCAKRDGNKQAECCTVVLLCKGKGPDFIVEECVSFPENISSGFGGVFIPYFITLEGLLCVCSFLLRLPRFLAARPIWTPDSQDF